MRTRLLYLLGTLLLLLPFTAYSQSIDDYFIFSNDGLTLRDRAKIRNGLVGSNTGMQMGYDSAITGTVKSRGNLTMKDRSTVYGSATLGGRLIPGSQTKVTGTLAQYASVPVITLPSTGVSDYTFVVDLTVPSGATKELQPFGMSYYRNVVVSSNANLVLGLGAYYFSTLTLEPDATITFEKGGEVWIVNELKISDRCRLIAGPDMLFTTDTRIYSDQTAALSIGTDGRIEAALILSRAAVTLGDRTALVGKLYAKAVTIGYDCPVSGAVSLDADGDGMPNAWENANGLNPNVNDADNDPDGDGLKNKDEFSWGTKPKTADTDGDGLNDGAERDYWNAHAGSMSPGDDPDNDGLANIIDPDSDNDGVLDGAELTGWTIVVQGTTKTYVGDAANPDSDFDGVPDGREKDGYAADFPNHTIDRVGIAASWDDDADGLDHSTELMFGLNPNDPQTIGSMSDRKYYQMVNHMGEWAVSPTTGHLNTQLASTSTCILEADVGFGDDTAANLSVDRQMEFSLFLPQDTQPVTLKLEFVYASGSSDANDRFYDVKYSGAVYPEGTDGAPAINYPGTGTSSIAWRITDPLYYLKGDYFVNFSYHYDKNAGEKPRKIRMYAYYDDGTRVRMQYVVPVKSGTYRSPMHFNLLVTGGAQPTYFRGETAVSSASASYIDNVVLKDYYGNEVRKIGKKAFNGYWFQYPLGKLNAYSGGVSGLTACQRLEFDWAHDASTDKHHCIFTIDEIGNKWDDVQIAYDRAYQTQDYYCWYGGVARNTAVVRRGNAVRVMATSGSLQYADAQVTVKNRAGADVTSLFNIHKETGCEDYAAYDGERSRWRENWIVEAPTTAPVGMYTITMRSGSAWSGSASFYLVFGRSEMSIADAEYDGYAYDEDADGLALDGDADVGVDLMNSYLFGESPYVTSAKPFSQTVTDMAVAAMDGKTGLYAARDAIRIFTSKLIDGINSGPNNKRAWFAPEVCLRYSGVTVAEAFAGTIDDSHRLWGDCAANAEISTTLARAGGIPGRMVSGWGAARIPNYDPDPVTGKTTPGVNAWGKHAWSEAWVETPVAPVTDHWYVYDSLSYMGSVYGISCSRVYYGSVWMDDDPSMVLVPSHTDPYVMPDVEIYYQP